jgi:hypothetical protein
VSELLDRVVAEIRAAPHSAAALTLYALVSTLEFEGAGYLFKLDKLRDLSPAQRELAYGLLELMARGGNVGVSWKAAKQTMDEIVRSA